MARSFAPRCVASPPSPTVSVGGSSSQSEWSGSFEELDWAQEVAGGGNELAVSMMSDLQSEEAAALGGQSQGAAESAVVIEAISSLPESVALGDPELYGCAAGAVEAAARAAFQLCLDEAIANDPAGLCPGPEGPSEAVVADALARYHAGPGVAVCSFEASLREAQGICPMPGEDPEATPEQLNAALAAYESRIGLSLAAYKVQTNDKITLATGHSSGKVDDATPDENIQDIVEGGDPDRSAYDGGPGGEVAMSQVVLDSLNALTAAPYGFSVRVSEITGGKHSGGKKEVDKGKGSKHYYGEAFDIDMINGKVANAANPDTAKLMKACRALGATLVLGPGSPGHDTHVHAEWT